MYYRYSALQDVQNISSFAIGLILVAFMVGLVRSFTGNLLPEHHSNQDRQEKREPCISWFLVAMAGAEALEHNAGVSVALMDIAPMLKGMLTEKEWDEVVGELDWFEHPIDEMTANIAVSGALSNLREQCNVDTTKAHSLFSEGLDALRASKCNIARQKFIDLKMELLSLGQKHMPG